MAVAMFMEWAGITPEQYDQTRDLVGWERQTPEGAILHIATFGPEGARVVDVWETEAAFQRFVEERLMPGVQQLGIPGQPNVQFSPVHALFTPGL